MKNIPVLNSILTEIEQKTQCRQCGKSFANADNLSRHKVIHSGEKLHQCDKCNQSFCRSDVLKQHMFRHGAEKPHKCEKCMQSFKRPYQLREHNRNENCMNRRYACFICKSSFLQSQYLKIHITKQHRNSGSLCANRDYPDKPVTEILHLTSMSRVARRESFIRNFARKPFMVVDEGNMLERFRCLKPGQVKALLAIKGSRVDITMDWVVRLCMLEKAEVKLQEVRDMCCSCGKVFKEIISLQTHQQWCNVIWSKKRTELRKYEANKSRNIDRNVVQKRNPEESKDFIKVETSLLDNSRHKNYVVGRRVKCVDIIKGGQVTTQLPSLPSLHSLHSLPPATLSSLQSLALLTPRLLQGTMSLQKVGRETGLQEEAIRAWRDSIKICLPGSGRKKT